MADYRLRYGPGYDVDERAVALEGLMEGFGGATDRRRQREADTRIQDLFDLQFHERGGRYGEAAPAEAEHRAPQIESFLQRMPTPGVTATPSAMPDDAGAAAGIDVGGLADVMGDVSTSLQRPKPAPAPGAFVPGMGFNFGFSAEPRFEQVREAGPGQRGIYYDRDESPAGIARADRRATREDTQAARQHEIRLRAQATADLERQRQGGRMDLETARQQGRSALRDKINQQGATNILLRARVSGSGGSRPATRGQIETNAMKAADGIIAASGGKYDDALDWLENTEEGRSARAAGLEARHLYAALGKFLSGNASAATRLQAGAGMFTPEESTQNVTETRERVTREGQRTATRARPDTTSRRPPPAIGRDSTGRPGPRAGARPDSAGGKRVITQAQKDALIRRGFKAADIDRKYTVR